jgi:putative MATE family efflux protein
MTERADPQTIAGRQPAGGVAGAPLDITHGTLAHALLRLAGPAILAKALHALLGLVDVFWVGRLGAAATAAVNTAFFAGWILEAATALTAVGILAYVSRRTGAADRARAAHAATQGVATGWVLGAGLAAAAWFAIPPLFHALAPAHEVSDPGIVYARTLYLGAPLTFTWVNAEAIMRAAGNTRTPLCITGSMVLLNAVLDPLLIFGIGPLPRLEVFGAALATVIAQAFAVAAFAVLALRRHPQLPLSWAGLRRWDAHQALGLLRVGAPAMAIGVLFSGVYLFLSGVAARLGTIELAILGLGNRAETFTYLGAAGFAEATGTVVGQNLGAGRADRAARAARLSALWLGGYGTLIGAILLLFPRQFLELFSSDPGVLATGTTYMRILGLCQGLMTIEIVCERAFAGAGDTLPPMLISVPMNLVRVPCVLWLVYVADAGILGIAWLLSITSALRGILAAVWFSRGRWKHRRL